MDNATFKQRFERAAHGPAAVRRLSQIRLLGIGAGVESAYRAWHERRRARWYERENRFACEAWDRVRPELSPLQQRVLGDLLSEGMAYASLSELVGGDALWNELSRDAAAWLASDDVQRREDEYRGAARRRGKDYLIRRYGRNAVIDWNSPWLRLATEPAVTAVVNAYLGLLAKIIYIDVWNTVPLRHDGPDIGSQRWHRDPEDARLIKTFLYLQDVTAGGGPFVYVPYSRAGEKYGRIWPQQFPAGSIPPEAEFEAAVPPADQRVCIGPAGTLLFVDTTGFHRGGRAEQDRRVVATVTYTSHACVWPRAFSLDRPAAPGDLSEPSRVALMTPDEPPPF